MFTFTEEQACSKLEVKQVVERLLHFAKEHIHFSLGLLLENIEDTTPLQSNKLFNISLISISLKKYPLFATASIIFTKTTSVL